MPGAAPANPLPTGRAERILICLTGRPSSAILIRRGKRVADYLHAECLAVHVGEDSADREAVERHMTFARNLRIETHVIPGRDVPGAVAELRPQPRSDSDFHGTLRPPALVEAIS